MKQLSMIACVSRDLGLGKDNALLWELSEDMRFFRSTTSGHPVVMGGNTFLSIGRALPERENLVLSREEIVAKSIKWFDDKARLDQYLQTLEGEKFIIGGASIYRLYLDEADTLYLTEVNGVKPADVYFPEFNQSDFNREVLKEGEQDGVKYQIVKYVRK